MNGTTAGRDARALALLSTSLPGSRTDAPPALGLAEWRRIGSQLRQAGLKRPGGLLEVSADFWPATGLSDAETARVQALLQRGDALDRELERLRGLGIRMITSVEPAYPARLRERLRGLSPPVLFGAGEWALLERPGLAIVGSRGVDVEGAAFTRAAAARCAREGLLVVSGGAGGVDQIAMQAALEGGGAALGVPAGHLEKIIKKADARRWMQESRLLLLSPLHPNVGFTVANAMSRNKLVYALAEYGLVVASAAGQGGTWAGAREALRHGWVPVFVRDDPSAPEGNRELLRPAARPFPPLEALGDAPLASWLAAQMAPPAAAPPVAAASACSEEGQDLFPLFWPHLAAFLRAPRLLCEVEDAFHLTRAQAATWVRRAEAEGRLTRERKRSRRYRCAPEPPVLQLRLFERGPGYGAAVDNQEGQQAGWTDLWPG